MLFVRYLRALPLILVLSLSVSFAHAKPEVLLQLVDYIGVDYPEAVVAGEVINQEEYSEMIEFSARVSAGLTTLETTPAVAEQLLTLSAQLQAQVKQFAEPRQVSATTQQLRNVLMENFELDLLPRKLPSLAKGAALYQENCVACHGVEGRGDGPLANTMEPAPTDFHELSRARERSLFGLYNTITLGVDGTGMSSFNQLSDGQRWSLAFYVGGLFAQSGEDNQQVWKESPLTIEQAVIKAPAELADGVEQGEALAVYARHNPKQLFSSQQAPLDVARVGISDSVEFYEEGNIPAAKQAAIIAYLEGFELTEASLNNVDPTLMREIEAAMMGYRALLDGKTSVARVAERALVVRAMLDQAEQVLASGSLSPGAAFVSALIILLREGLEAILVVAAMAAFLTKTGRRDGLRWLHAGWLLALVAGAATWAVSNWMFTISGATREITEGFTALVAAGILFYVGFWMHSRANAQKWSQYIESQMGAAISKGALWSFAVVSFLAVYREIFETILFYQALWAQVDSTSHSAVTGGAALAVGLLVMITVMINRFGMRLPLALFFTVTAYLMITLAFVFVGKGVAALQEAGRLPIDPVSFPRVEWLGIYPNLQGLLLQALVVALAVGLLIWQRRKTAA